MKTINELQNEVIEEFSDFDDWMDRNHSPPNIKQNKT